MITTHRHSWSSDVARLFSFVCAMALAVGAGLPADAQDRRWTRTNEVASPDLYYPAGNNGAACRRLPNRVSARFIVVRPSQTVVINPNGGMPVQIYTQEPAPETVPADGQMGPEEIRQLIGFVPERVQPSSRNEPRQDRHEGRVGTPERDSAFWQRQTTTFTCAVQAQRGIIEEIGRASCRERVFGFV
jgi:hypothetical protein